MVDMNMKGTEIDAGSKRQILVDTALKLFAQYGYHGTGIDLILKESGVAKKTMYKYFPSKEDLIVEVLRQYGQRFKRALECRPGPKAAGPRQCLLAIFDAAVQWFEEDGYHGCMYINAMGEYAEGSSEIRRVCQEFKDELRDYIANLCTSAGVSKPRLVANQISLLLEGAIVTAQVSRKPDAAETAKRIADLIIKNASSTGSSSGSAVHRR